ncbi:MAG: Holliday junction resolvase-like protein [Bacteroidales bacterium]
MSNHQKIIDQLNGMEGLKIECPECNESFSIRRANLFSVKDTIPDRIAKIIANRNAELKERLTEIREERKELRTRKQERPKRIKVTTESVNFGKIVEKIIPSFESFPYDPNDCRALYEPIDYIIFGDYSKTGKCNYIVFSDVKSGRAQLEDNQKQIKRLVNSGKVSVKIER